MCLFMRENREGQLRMVHPMSCLPAGVRTQHMHQENSRREAATQEALTVYEIKFNSANTVLLMTKTAITSRLQLLQQVSPYI